LGFTLGRHERVRFALQEGLEGVGGGVDDGLALEVERGIQNHGHPGALPEALDQGVVVGAVFPEDGLQAPGAIHVGDCRQEAGLRFLHRNDVKHVARRMQAAELCHPQAAVVRRLHVSRPTGGFLRASRQPGRPRDLASLDLL